MSSSARGLRTRPGRQTRSSAAGGKEQNGQKRDGYDRDDDREPDMSAKRPKITEEVDGEPNSTVDTLLGLISSSDLKKICAKVLEDEKGGAKLRDELLSCTEDILARSRAETQKESSAIISEAERSLYEFSENQMEKCKGMCEIEDWAGLLYPSLRRIEALHNRGPLTGGPEMAWKALLKVTEFCIRDWDDGELSFHGLGEEDCDEFHEDADALMLIICEAQKENGKISWLRDGRKEEIMRLRRETEKKERKQFPYRYENVLKFLEQL
ncbi:hypothetical protein F5Y07DRAFT_348421 [Xylaria sp. FL0933]|nr:hypothetical protein F5Y07DRAFT_348421 [Xylaria sp. FL0933]